MLQKAARLRSFSLFDSSERAARGFASREYSVQRVQKDAYNDVNGSVKHKPFVTQGQLGNEYLLGLGNRRKRRLMQQLTFLNVHHRVPRKLFQHSIREHYNSSTPRVSLV